jgi:hypothetical protein
MSSDADTPSLSSTEASDQSSTDSTQQNATESVTNNETSTIVPAGPIVRPYSPYEQSDF